MYNDKFLYIIIFLLAAVIFYLQCVKPKSSVVKSAQQESNKEGFLMTGGMTNLGSIDYDLIPQEPALDSHELLGAPDFADLVDSGDQAVQASGSDQTVKPLERLQTLSDSYIPRVASKALPFSQAAAKPLVHSYSVNIPRVNLKGKNYEMNLAEAVRGSVYINYDPNVALVGKSRYGPSDAYNPGMMTPVFDAMYNKLSGSYKNMPLYTAGSASASNSSQGAGIDVIMDI